ncbi:TonB-dependent receptor plug domain-containing protein [Salipiger sp.]|uniref:TonB-dependent receptor plug domain-containing protein n=1 Tax=Salipiger sp. TaxID=2078585 RepID=UPI003A97AD9B
MKHVLTTASVLALSTTPLLAQDDGYYQLPTLLLDVGYEATAPLRTGVTVDVLTEEDLQNDGDTRVVDILARTPGLTIRSNGPLGTNASIAIRGVSQQNIAVRIDGIDVSDPSGTQVAYDFGGLTGGDIGQIEILRGSQSALYGSEAIGGAINITTKRATREGLSAEGFLEYGSYETFRSAATLFNKGEGHETAVTLSYVTSAGFSAADEDGLNYGTSDPSDTNDEDDGFEARRLSFSGSYELGGGAAELQISGFAEESQYDYDESYNFGSGPQVFDGTPDDVTDVEQYGLRAALKFEAGRVDHELSASYFEVSRVLHGTSLSFQTRENGEEIDPVTPPYAGAPYPFRFKYDGERHTYGYQAGVDLSPRTRLVAGLRRTREIYADHTYGEYRYEDFFTGDIVYDSYDNDQDADTTVDSLYGELVMRPNADIDLSLALRHDEHSEFGGFTTARLSGMWRAAPDLSFRANLANGYRAPSNYELYDAYSGNSDLSPETSVSFDIGVEKSFGDSALISATAFWIEAEDIIDYSYTSYGYVQADGISSRAGLELAGELDLAETVSLDGSYTWTDSWSTASLDSSSWQVAVPEHAFSLGVTADLSERVQLRVSGYYEADRAEVDDYGLVNTSFTYDVTDETQAYLRIENLFDEDYQTVKGYGQSGRAYYAGIRARF